MAGEGDESHAKIVIVVGPKGGPKGSCLKAQKMLKRDYTNHRHYYD